MARLHVFLDTSILSRVPRRDSAAFQTLDRLCRDGRVVVHLSAITVREFVSQEDAHLEKAIDTMQRGLHDVKRRGPGSQTLQLLERVEAAARELELNLTGAAEARLTEWLTRVEAEVHDPNPGHTRLVFDNYFEGGPPFKTKKNRKDLPDAFIYEALREVASSESRVHAVVADRQLRESAGEVPGVVVYESLDHLMTSSDVQALVRNATAEENLDTLREVLQDSRAKLEAIIREDLVDVLAGETIESPLIPDDNQTAMIGMVSDAGEIAYSTADVDYYGEGGVVVPFEAEAEVIAAYSIFKAEWYALPSHKAKRISISECNDHYFDAEESFIVRVAGSIRIQFEDGLLEGRPMNSAELGDALSRAEICLDGVEVTGIVVPGQPDLRAF